MRRNSVAGRSTRRADPPQRELSAAVKLGKAGAAPLRASSVLNATHASAQHAHVFVGQPEH